MSLARGVVVSVALLFLAYASTYGLDLLGAVAFGQESLSSEEINQLKTDWPVILVLVLSWIAGLVVATLALVFLASVIALSPSKPNLRIPVTWGLSIIALFGVVSIFMMLQGVGITTVMEGRALPFQLAGFLNYFRLLAVPLIFLIILAGTPSRWIYFVSCAIFIEAVIAAGTSGSRLVGIVHGLPLLFAAIGKSKAFTMWVLNLFAVISVASVSRTTLVPVVTERFLSNISTSEQILTIYGSASRSTLVQQLRSANPINVVLDRLLGLRELLLTLRSTESFPELPTQVINWAASIGMPINAPKECLTTHEINAVPADAYGYWGIDPLGGLVVASCGSTWLVGASGLVAALLVGVASLLALRTEKTFAIPGMFLVVSGMSILLVFEARFRVMILLIGALLLCDFALRRASGVGWDRTLRPNLS